MLIRSERVLQGLDRHGLTSRHLLHPANTAMRRGHVVRFRMTPRSRRNVGLAIVSALGALLAPAVPSAKSDPRFHGGRVYVAWDACTGRRYRPQAITFACGDGGLWATNIVYHTYGGKTATASVSLHTHDCIPNCAQSPYHAFSATIVLKDIARCEGTLYYSRAKWHFINGAPYGGPSSGPADIEPFGDEGEKICGPILG
jgi:hypothetical protein